MSERNNLSEIATFPYGRELATLARITTEPRSLGRTRPILTMSLAVVSGCPKQSDTYRQCQMWAYPSGWLNVWQDNREFRSDSQGAFYIDGAAMEENDMFYNGKPEAGATKFF